MNFEMIIIIIKCLVWLVTGFCYLSHSVLKGHFLSKTKKVQNIDYLTTSIIISPSKSQNICDHNLIA